ncbi:hypothetical protein HDU97_005557 [Phlyctochytrium planicorne]|nr:hypothetical protein HDU97_005557 [Phlyctochytrium planicorne]
MTSQDLMSLNNDVYQHSPPPFGREMRKLFALEDGYTSLNHGSFGTTPLPVFQYRVALLSYIESNPDRFYKYQIQPALEFALSTIAAAIKVDHRDIAFVENATTGVNVALRSIKSIMNRPGRLRPRGRKFILQLSTVYHYVGLATAYTAKAEGLEILKVQVAYPISDAELVGLVKAAIEMEERKGNTVVLAIFDAIASVPAVVLPLWELIPLCRSHSIFTLIDAAHAIGQIPLQPILSLDPDLLVTNLHKWMYAPRGAAILYHSPRHHRLGQGGDPIIAHPVLSEVGSLDGKPSIYVGGHTPEWKRSFLWMGTSDVSRYLSSLEAFRFREWIGGEDKIMKYCHHLAVQGGGLVANMWGTEVMPRPGSQGYGRSTEGYERSVAMVNVRVPHEDTPRADGQSRSEYLSTLQELLMNKFGMAVYLYQHNGEWYARLSAQVYNDLRDFEKVGRTLLHLLRGGESSKL